MGRKPKAHTVQLRPRMTGAFTYSTECTHPNASNGLKCAMLAIGEFDIPAEYTPERRHLHAPPMPRPTAMLCRRHGAMVTAFANKIDFNGNSHEALCAVCQHPDGAAIMDLWMRWAIAEDTVIGELGISHKSFWTHVNYFGLMEKKTNSAGRRRALGVAAEKGLAVGDHNVRSGIAAIDAMNKMEQRTQRVHHDHKVSGNVLHAHLHGEVDFTKMSDGDLAAHFETLAKKLRLSATASATAKAALPPGELEEDTLDLGDVIDGELVEADHGDS